MKSPRLTGGAKEDAGGETGDGTGSCDSKLHANTSMPHLPVTAGATFGVMRQRCGSRSGLVRSPACSLLILSRRGFNELCGELAAKARKAYVEFSSI
eukprot:354152-Chlamydomonas_euryale.AAC.2